jgi:hypothetical protein
LPGCIEITLRIIPAAAFAFKSSMTGVSVTCETSTRYVPGAITRPAAWNSNGIAAVNVYVCAEAAPAATTKAAVAIISLVFSFCIVIPSVGSAGAFPLCTGALQLACQSAGARKALKTRSREVDFRHL